MLVGCRWHDPGKQPATLRPNREGMTITTPTGIPFATMLRRLRERALLTQEQLATRTGLGVRTIRRLESSHLSRPRGESVRRLADALELTDSDQALLIAAARVEPGRHRLATEPVAHQLPAAPRHFVGREAELKALTALLDQTSQPHGTVAIASIDGTGGIGKTAVAVRWAHTVAHRFPDGHLYVNLRGFDPTGSPMAPSEAIRGFLEALSVPAERIPASLDAQASLYRSLLSGRRVLVMLDNARDVGQVRPLLPASNSCLVLVTSRNRLTGLVAGEGAYPLTLDLLNDAEARELLDRHLGPQRLAAEPAVADELVARCARLPLALAIVAARAAARPAFPLSTFAAELATAHQRLDALDAGDEATRIRSVFSWSYRQLRPATAGLFRMLGLIAGPDIAVAAAASLAGTSVDHTRRLLAQLSDAHMVIEHAPGRFAFHDLLRAYATDLSQTQDSAAERRAAVHRVLDHYLHTAHNAAELLYPHRESIALHPCHGAVGPEHLADRGQALNWFTAEHPALLAAIGQATRHGFDTHTWQLIWTLQHFLHFRRSWHELVPVCSAAVDAVRRLTDPAEQAHGYDVVALLHEQLGRHGDAHAYYKHAIDLFGQLGDCVGQATARRRMATLFHRRSQPRAALREAQQALALYRAAGHRTGEAIGLNAVGWYHAQVGEHEKALAYCRQALVLHQETGNLLGAAATHDSLGYAHHHLGSHRQAVTHYLRALDLYRDVGDRDGEAETLTHLGTAHHAAGNPDAARDTWQRALTILTELHNPGADRVRAMLDQLVATRR
jgi:tetratricopeptide (TPR) repeat protein/transcriptional regulator with XRE-family HTH domain